MTDFATLVLASDARSLKQGEDALDSIAKTAQTTEKSVTSSMDGVTDALKTVPPAARPVAPALSNAATAANEATGAMALLGGNSRMLTQQLSQVAQQGAATGQWAQAFAIQAADIGLAFGPVGTVIGVLAMIGLPALSNALFGAADAADTLRENVDALTASEKAYMQAIAVGQQSTEDLTKKFGALASQVKETQGVIADAIAINALKELSAASNDLLTPLEAANRAFVTLSQAENQVGLDGRTNAMAIAAQTEALNEQLQAIGLTREQLGSLDIAWAGLIHETDPAKISGDAQEILNILQDIATQSGGLPAALAPMVLEVEKIRDAALPAADSIAAAADASHDLAQQLGPVANLSFGNLDNINTSIGNAIPGVHELYGVLFNMTQLKFDNLPGLSGGSVGGLTYGDAGNNTGYSLGGPAVAASAAQAEYSLGQVSDALGGVKVAATGGGGGGGGAAAALKPVEINLSDLAAVAAQAADDLVAARKSIASDFTGIGDSLSSIADGDVLSGVEGLSDAFRGLGDEIPALSSTVGALGTAMSSVLPALGLVQTLFQALQSTTVVLAEGLNLTVDAAGVAAETFRTTKTTSFFGLFSSTNTTTSAADPATVDALDALYAQTQTAVQASAAQLGMGADTFADFTTSLSLDLQGMNAQEQSDAIAAAFAGIEDSMADLVLAGLEIPPTVSDTSAYMDQLAESLTAYNDVAQLLGWQMMDLTAASGQAADSIVQLYGSLENFQNTTQFYFDNILSGSEQLAALSEDFATQLNDLGVTTIPKTNDEFQALVDTFQAAGDSEAVAQLMQLAPEFVQITTLQEQAAQAAEDAAQAAQDATDALLGVADATKYATQYDYNKANAIGVQAAAQAPAPPPPTLEKTKNQPDNDARLRSMEQSLSTMAGLMRNWNGAGLLTRTS